MLSEFTEEQQLMRDSVREFVQQEVAPAAKIMEETDEYPYEMMKRCGELGLTGLMFPEAVGGAGMGLTEFALALEEISKESQTLAICLDASITLCFLPILMFGTDEQRAKYIPRAVQGEIIGAYAMSEPSGATNFAAHTSTAVRDGDEWVINGQKIFCTNSEAADVYLIFASVDGNPMSTCFIVDKDTPGLVFGEKEEKLGWHGSYTGTIYMNDLRVPADSVLGEFHGALEATALSIAHSCIGIGAMCCGSAAGAYQKALDYVRMRNIGGQVLLQYQPVADTIARMAMDIETSRALVYKAARRVDAGNMPIFGTPEGFLASACKIQPPEMAARVCDQAIQLFGGTGYCNADIHRYWRDVRACQIGEGPTSTHLQYIAAALAENNVI